MQNEIYDAKSCFESVTPEEVGIPSDAILDLIDTFAARRIQMHSLMILRHGKVAANLWWRPYAPHHPHHLYSFSKSFTSTAVGFAIAEGLLSASDRIAKFFPRRIEKDADDRIFSVTVEHLLTMTSGAVSQNEATMQMQVDWVKWFLNTPLKYDPGERFIYNSLNTYMLAAILRRVTGVGLVDYLMPRLFEPLGIDRPQWKTCHMGIECGGWGLSLKTEDLAKFSQLYLDDGMWQGKRILPEGWTQLAGSCRVPSTGDDKMSDGPDNTSGYGYQFWINRDQCSYRADGMMGQYGIVMPQKDMVIVTTAGCAEQLKLIDALWDVFIPRVDEIPHGTAAGVEYDELCGIARELSLPVPTQTARDRETEKLVHGRVYKFPVNYSSLLPFPIRYLHDIDSVGIDDIRVDFGDEISTLHWHEDGTNHELDFRLDGEYTAGQLTYGGETMDTQTIAAWISPATLEIDIRLIRTPHMKRVMLTFEGNFVYYTFDEDPSLEDSAKTLIDMVKPFRSFSAGMAKFANKLVHKLRGEAQPAEIKAE